MKIYVSGKVSGLEMNVVQQKFVYSCDMLRDLGCKVVNPLEISEFDEAKTWEAYMADDLAELLTCDAIYMQADWGQSRGARVEYAVARELGLEVFYEGDFNW